MAARIPPHVTLVYPQEANDEDLLMERVASAASQTGSFPMTLGRVEESNLGGVWIRVADPSETWSKLRRLVLGPPFTPYPVVPHVTVVHPRTSERGPDALVNITDVFVQEKCEFDEVLFTETSRSEMKVLQRFPLTG